MEDEKIDTTVNITDPQTHRFRKSWQSLLSRKVPGLPDWLGETNLKWSSTFLFFRFRLPVNQSLNGFGDVSAAMASRHRDANKNSCLFG